MTESSKYPVYIGECTAKRNYENLSKNVMHTNTYDCLDIITNMLVDYGFVPVIWDIPESFYSRRIGTIMDKRNAEVIRSIAYRIDAKLADGIKEPANGTPNEYWITGRWTLIVDHQLILSK